MIAPHDLSKAILGLMVTAIISLFGWIFSISRETATMAADLAHEKEGRSAVVVEIREMRREQREDIADLRSEVRALGRRGR